MRSLLSMPADRLSAIYRERSVSERCSRLASVADDAELVPLGSTMTWKDVASSVTTDPTPRMAGVWPHPPPTGVRRTMIGVCAALW
jgi:hypothetical protein